MTRPLRRAHRIIFLALAVALPVLVAMALIGRPAPATSALPPAPGLVR
jgi:hypothetical protein